MATKTDRQSAYQLAKHEEVAGIRVRLAERYGKDEIAKLSTCCICQLPIDPAAVVNPDGEPFKDHPKCVSTKSERKAA